MKRKANATIAAAAAAVVTIPVLVLVCGGSQGAKMINDPALATSHAVNDKGDASITIANDASHVRWLSSALRMENCGLGHHSETHRVFITRDGHRLHGQHGGRRRIQVRVVQVESFGRTEGTGGHVAWEKTTFLRNRDGEITPMVCRKYSGGSLWLAEDV